MNKPLSAPSSSPANAHGASAFVWMALLAVGLLVGLWSLAQARLAPDRKTVAAWLEGAAETALNQSLRLPGQAAIETVNASVRYRFFGDLGEKVVLGCPQWMFYQDGLRAPPGTPASVVTERLQLLKHWHDELLRRNVQLLVVAVPDKARVEARHLCGRTMAQTLHARYDMLARTLARNAIGFVDLRGALEGQKEPMFFRTDVHMNAAGAQRAAQAVASKALVQLGGERGGQEFEVSPPTEPRPRMGDLLTLSGLQHAAPLWRPDIELVPEQTVTPVRGGGLLDETPPVRVLLAGSSNGLRSNFAGWLGKALGQEVWNLSMDGGQFAGAMLKAVAQADRWPQSLRLVIWEFSENTLSLPLTDDEKKALAALPAPPAP